MNKKLSISILILAISTYLVYGQQITFYKNINPKASRLLQSLNKTEDSLFLESKHQQIVQVDIFNHEFSERIDIKSNVSKIDLSKLPLGNFVIQAKVDKKWIVMYLEKKDHGNLSSSNQEQQNINYKGVAFKGKTNIIEKNKNALYYWVVTESNSNFGSNKSMRLEKKESIDKLISKNKLELKSNVGKDNILLIYAIYNKSEFMTKQLRNREYYKSAETSKFFGKEPYYASEYEKTTDSNP
jgi:hypothetical protein